MQRRCIICGQEPCGYYMYPRTLTEARKWQDWANIYSFNVPAGTLRKHGCVCQKHLESVDDLVDPKGEEVKEKKERSVGGTPTPVRGPSAKKEGQRQGVNFTENNPNQMNVSQQVTQCYCPDSAMITQPYQQQLSQQRTQCCCREPQQIVQVQKQRRRKERKNKPAKSSSSVSERKPHVNVCSCPGTTQIPRPPFQYGSAQTVKYDSAPLWFTNQANQYQLQQQQQLRHNLNQSQYSSETGTGTSASNPKSYAGQSSGYPQQCGITNCCYESECPFLTKQFTNLSNRPPPYQQLRQMQCPNKNQYQQSQWCQCCLNVPNCDQQLQCPSQVYQTAKCRSSRQTVSEAPSTSAAPATVDPSPDTCECGTITSQNNVTADKDRGEVIEKKKVRNLPKDSNAVNVLIMGAYGQEEDDDFAESVPATFQPSPVTEICLLESDLTKGNERAIFPDIDLPNYSVCRAPTTDPKTDKKGEEKEDGSCADVLVLGKGLKDIDPCPCDCAHCLFDMDIWNCPNHRKPDNISALRQSSQLSAAFSTKEEKSGKTPPLLPNQLVDGNWQDPEAETKYNQMIADQKARINELEDLLTQHNILQQTIQSKVDELQSKL